MDYHDRITSNPDVMLGKPVVKGTRITVEHLLRKLSEGMPIDEILVAYPHLTREDVLAVLSFPADAVGSEGTTGKAELDKSIARGHRDARLKRGRFVD